MKACKLLITSSAVALTCFAVPAWGQAATPDSPATQTTDADAQQNAATADPAEAHAPDVVVTGSRIRRAGFDAPTPVAVSDAQDVKLSGQVNIERALLELPQVSLGANAFTLAVTGSGGGFADVNLRGLGSNRNLVLVNGRRFAIVNASQITDTNTIPAGLIDRTEIVTGGSSAVYGSDAITGVVNFILKQNYDGIEGRYQLNLVPHSTTPTYNVDLTLGKNFAEGRGNVALALNFLERKGNTRDDFDWSRFSFVLGEGCIVPGSGTATTPGTRFSIPSGQSCQQAGGAIGYVFNGSADIPNGRVFGIPAFGGSNAALNAAYTAAGLSGLTANGFTFNDAGTAARPYDSTTDSYNNTPPNSLQIPQTRYMANAFAHYDFSDAAKVYGEFHYSRNEVTAQIAPPNYNAPFLVNVNNPYLTPQLREVFRQLDLAETGPRTVTHGVTTFTTTPSDGLAVVSLGRRFSDLGPRTSFNKRDVFRGAVGIRGDLGDASRGFLTDLTYDLYYTLSDADETITVINGVSRSRLQQNLLSVGTAAPVCNIFGQNISTACAQAIGVGATAGNKARMQVAQGNVTGSLFALPAGPVGFSLGAEWRKTSARFIPDAVLATGDAAGYTGALPTNGSVTAKELFGEVRIPLIHDTPLIESLTANAGFRMSDYSLSGVGTVWTYFYGGEWRVTSDLNVRGQYQRAIRAPSVGELFGGQVSGNNNVNDPCSSRAAASQQTADVRALCIATGVPAALVYTLTVQPAPFVYTVSGGNPNLDAEKADTFTAGVVLTPRFLPRFSASVDYFDISVDGAIGQRGGGPQNVFNLCYYVVRDASSEYCRAIPRDSTTGEILASSPVDILSANTGGVKVRGIDFAINYRQPIGTSSLALRSNYTYLLEYTNTPVQALPLRNECVGSFGNTCGDAKPRWRGTTRATWSVDDFSLSLRHRYLGPVTTDRYLLPLRQGSATTPALSTLAFPRIKSQNYFDISFDVGVADKMRFYGGVNNVFNRDVPNVSSVGLYDPMGTELFLGTSFKF